MTEHRDVREFTEVWQRDGPRVAAYARRHVVANDVSDVVAETFLHAWRRWADVPRPPLPWLIGAARKVVGNERRGEGRRRALEHRIVLLGDAARSAEDAGLLATDRMTALAALAALPEQQREALLLVAWDGLTPDQAAAVMGVRPGTFRVRTHRARSAAQQALDLSEPPARLARVSLSTAPKGGI
ncbi:MAG TPA: sigma-70 family RNA polymerase sigma factor [Nocardioides sp.]|nr:sigma-70 family RNA polymerase sigma factor [Nocardioides sp.]